MMDVQKKNQSKLNIKTITFLQKFYLILLLNEQGHLSIVYKAVNK